MTVDQLYYICENVGPYTYFMLYEGKKPLAMEKWIDLPPEYGHRVVFGFKFINDHQIAVYI